MLDATCDDTMTFAEIIQSMYDLAGDGATLSPCLEAFARHLKADGGHLQVETRDQGCYRLGAEVIPPSPGAVMGIGDTDRLGIARYRLTLWRLSGPEFSAAEHAMATDFLGHLRRAIILQWKLCRNGTEIDLLDQVLDRLAVGAIILNQQGQVIEACGIAKDILRDQLGLRESRGKIAAIDPGDNRLLQQMLREALSGDPVKCRSLAIERDALGLRSLGVVTQALPRRPSGMDAGAAVLFLRDPDRSLSAEQTLMRHLHDFTPAEAALACTLSHGHSLDEAAAELSISRNTARAHLRSIFSKSGITRQTELMRLVLTSAAVIARPAAA